MGDQLGIPAMGIIAPIGSNKDATAQALWAGGRAGLSLRADIAVGRKVYVGAVADEFPSIPAGLEGFASRNNRMMLAALAQIADAVRAAVARYGCARVAVILGTSTGGLAEGEHAYGQRKTTGVWPNSYAYTLQEVGGLAECAAQAFGITGPAYTVATACSSSAKVFASARRLIRAGFCDAAVVGGCDTLCGTTVNGFGALESLSAGICNPFSANRDGLNIGEAAAAFLLVPEDAPVQLLGIGESSDAYHISAPDPQGIGAAAAMTRALEDAGIEPSDIGYINLHGTATRLNDAMEARAVDSVFGLETPCSSTKAMTGHTLGAAGACEAAFLWLALHPQYGDGRVPPHLWDGVRDDDIPSLALAPKGLRLPPTERAAMLSNSFAFGGSNCSLILARGFPA